MSNYAIALTTCPTKNSKDIALTLVKKRLCACVNIIPKMTSIYHWKGEVVTDEESLLIIKTNADLNDVLCNAIKEIHPYDTPEFIVIPIEWGSEEYLTWIGDSISESQ